jgi:hypothetical protein
MSRNRNHSAFDWHPDADYRIVCECQRHARRERTLWRRSVRLAGRARAQLNRRAVALLIGVPLVFGAVGIPTEAMNLNIPLTGPRSALSVIATDTANTFHIFTTRRTRQTFLQPRPPVPVFTLDVAKEDFFRTRVPYGSIIYREALKNGLAPELVAAVVEAESDFRVRLVSEKQAMGLMQIIPSTGRLLGADDLFDPEKNVAAGTKYLRYLVDRFGDQRVALAAYNAGEGNVERFGGVPPFPETITYVQRVSTRVHLYRQRVRSSYLTASRIQPTSH